MPLKPDANRTPNEIPKFEEEESEISELADLELNEFRTGITRGGYTSTPSRPSLRNRPTSRNPVRHGYNTRSKPLSADPEPSTETGPSSSDPQPGPSTEPDPVEIPSGGSEIAETSFNSGDNLLNSLDPQSSLNIGGGSSLFDSGAGLLSSGASAVSSTTSTVASVGAAVALGAASSAVGYGISSTLSPDKGDQQSPNKPSPAKKRKGGKPLPRLEISDRSQGLRDQDIANYRSKLREWINKEFPQVSLNSSKQAPSTCKYVFILLIYYSV
uniref:Uncharacterized protein n=1 Tax=Lanius cristatus ambidensovirus TaxID=2794461 RepID=A0A8A4XCZ7_9VIRU|nr:MAG: hypothetical protein [Lanius cristatus ambidensovirus]